MKLRNLALSSAAILAIAAGAACADPAAGNPYTQNPTPDERAQTQQLNAQAASDAQVPPQPTPADQTQYQVQQDQYQAQQQQYENDQMRYQAQQDRYRDERAEFFYDRSHPYTWWRDRYERASLDLFYGVPRDELIDLRVVRDDGFTIGRIRGYERASDGRVAAVKIVFRNGGVAWIKARDLRYDPDSRIVFTDLTVPELREIARNS
jgi:hypothetical protein